MKLWGSPRTRAAAAKTKADARVAARAAAGTQKCKKFEMDSELVRNYWAAEIK